MRYFVTGGTGFIGRRVMAELLDAGHRVNALVRSRALADKLSGAVPNISVFQGDITDKQSMRAAMEGVDGVFHLAAWYRIGAHDTTLAEWTNVGGTRNVLELMRELGIPKGVYTSTVAVFSDTRGKLPDASYRHRGRWLSEYERTKALAAATAVVGSIVPLPPPPKPCAWPPAALTSAPRPRPSARLAFIRARWKRGCAKRFLKR